MKMFSVWGEEEGGGRVEGVGERQEVVEKEEGGRSKGSWRRKRGRGRSTRRWDGGNGGGEWGGEWERKGW